jgi:hypothetical protein
LAKTVGFFFSDLKPYREFNFLFDWISFKNKFDLLFLFSHNIVDSSVNYQQILFDPRIIRLHAFLHSSLLWQKRNTSLSYKLKANSYFGSSFLVNASSSFLNHYKQRRNLIERTFIKIFGNRVGIFTLSKMIKLFFWLKSIKLNKKILELNCIVFPYGGRVSIVQDFLVWFGKKNKINTLAIQENWDNLSSKTILFQHPDFFATWGKQSSSQLIKIHEYNGRAFEVGSLRIYDIYQFRKNYVETNTSTPAKSENQELNSNYLLLIGTGDAEFDLKIAEVCSKIINESSFFMKSNYTLIYRPHPYSRIQSMEFDQITMLPGLVVDKPIESENNQYRISLIAKSSLVIALYSTVILEAAILNKPILIPSFIDIDFAFKTKDFIDLSEHFMGVSALESISNPNTVIEFSELLHYYCLSNTEVKNNEKLLNWFCLDANTNSLVHDLIFNISK